jgi:formate/nitrite transporter
MGQKKLLIAWSARAVLGLLGGAFIALGYLLSLRVTVGLPPEWGGVSSLVGASVFPVGLILVLLAGAELVTGNMTAIPLAQLTSAVRVRDVAVNLVVITAFNFVGAVLVAYVFGHLAGLTSSGPMVGHVAEVAGHKLDATFTQAFISGIGCNWLVGLAVWLSYGAKETVGKIVAIWWPTMAFVAIGFQHVVANMFVIPAAIFEGNATWSDAFANFVPVWSGNLVGGSVFVAGAYYVAYLREPGSGLSRARPATLQPVPAEASER